MFDTPPVLDTKERKLADSNGGGPRGPDPDPGGRGDGDDGNPDPNYIPGAGLLAMRGAGARTIGQNKASSVVYGMPKVAFECGAVERQLPLDDIRACLLQLSSSGRT